VVLYYTWHLLKQNAPSRFERYEFVIFGSLLAGIALNSGSAQKFIYFQF